MTLAMRVAASLLPPHRLQRGTLQDIHCSLPILAHSDGHLAIEQIALLEQELQERVLQVVSAAAVPSPAQPGQRSARWPKVREALEGLQLSSSAVQQCKHFLLQVCGKQ